MQKKHKRTHLRFGLLFFCFALGACGGSGDDGADAKETDDPGGSDAETDDSKETDNSGTGSDDPSLPGWQLVHHERFDAPFVEPSSWIEDSYGPSSPYHVGPFDEDGDFFVDKGGSTFENALAAFRSFRKSFTYGDDGWLTVELYGRDSDRDGTPESGGKFTANNGKAKLVLTRHYDGGIIRATSPLPPQYRVEVTVSGIEFGGKRGDSWNYDGKVNGYSGGDELGDPWRFTDWSTTPLDAYLENGLYFLCITDYARPAPHNNVFIHHHRKVVMDSDNNMDQWSKVYNPKTDIFDPDGSHYLSMLWLNGEDFGDDWTGNSFVSYIPRETDYFVYEPTMANKYLDNESYVFVIERHDDNYTLEITGNFYHGGQATMRMSKSFRDWPVVWHYNQTAAEYDIDDKNQVKTFNGNSFDTWPKGSAYPDFFFFGDPHINYYEGTVLYDDLKLYVPS